ncbi:MAG TPA: D-alanyl-D-alanine carboxypeptidase/D-alanyl-D-alanine-endopeptidase [Jatrophihabitans sp.]|nr:D-alanyl-D-alanine carboxypeptidase/D-alanyl-D-alanine-endopeptidase [Jatrophihabitans sp.]
MIRPGTTPIRVVLLVMVGVLLLAAGYLGVAGGRQLAANWAFHPIRVPAATAAATDVAGPLSAATAPVGTPAKPVAGLPPSPAGVAAALAGPLSAGGLGPSMAAQVFDAQAGTALFSRRADQLVAPASTSKLLTAAAVLTRYRDTDRFSTRVLAGPTPGSVVLVGGGDPTLSAAPAGQATEYPEAARVSELARAVRASAGGTPISQVIVDDSLFTGPTTAPGWAPEDAPSSYASPITATMVDAGRDSPDAAIRSAAPDLAAGQALAKVLGAGQVSRGTATAGARQLAKVQSAPVGVLVEQMLRDSDNVIAEVLARQVAIAAHQPASFSAAAAAISSTLAPAGVTVGDGMRDGSGLSGQDRIPAAALGQVLLATTGTGHPQWRPILSGLSVAGWDGSLVEQDRFTGSATERADGAVRAKTGSLTGVSAMAGVLTDADGRQLIFVFVADQTPGETDARTAIDQLAATLVRCGCH